MPRYAGTGMSKKNCRPLRTKINVLQIETSIIWRAEKKSLLVTKPKISILFICRPQDRQPSAKIPGGPAFDVV